MFLSGNAIAIVLISATGTLAHGIVTGIVVDGVYYDGYQPKFQFMETQPVVVGWSTPKDLNTGYVAPDAYASPDIICHVGATNAQTFATVKAGGTVEMQWTAWPESHHGPVIDYLANCNGDCATVSKTALEFFKIDGIGLLSDDTLPGTWASDTLIAKNNSWSVTIPSDIAPGNYVLRHEIIALHSAQGLDGAQNYPQCFNLQVTGSGTEHPEGILGEKLYQETEPGIMVNIYTSLSTYIVPGPTLYSGAGAQSQTIVGSVTTSATIQAPTSTTFSTIASVSGSFRVTSSLTRFLNSTSTTSSRFRPTLTNTPLIPTTNSELSVASMEPIALTASSSIPTPTVSTISEIVTITTCSSTAPTTTINANTNSISASVEMPAGTTLDDLLSWISTFYAKHGKEAYAENTVARRHARQVVYK